MEVADWSPGNVFSLVEPAAKHQVHTMAESGATFNDVVQRLYEFYQVDLLASATSGDICYSYVHASG